LFRDGTTDIYTINADGSGRVRLTTDPAEDHSPVWSPDGQWIAFASRLPGSGRLNVMRADGSQLTRLVDEQYVASLAWSADGQHLAYKSENGVLVIVRADGSRPVRISILVRGFDWAPQ
jgi:TolB protein